MGLAPRSRAARHARLRALLSGARDSKEASSLRVSRALLRWSHALRASRAALATPEPGSFEALLACRVAAAVRWRAAGAREASRSAAARPAGDARAAGSPRPRAGATLRRSSDPRATLAASAWAAREGAAVAQASSAAASDVAAAGASAALSLYASLFATLAECGALEAPAPRAALLAQLAALAAPGGDSGLAGAPALPLRPVRAWLRAVAEDEGDAAAAMAALLALATAQGSLLDVLAVARPLRRLLARGGGGIAAQGAARAAAAMRLAAGGAALPLPTPREATFVGAAPLPHATAGGPRAVLAMASGAGCIFVMHAGGTLRRISTHGSPSSSAAPSSASTTLWADTPQRPAPPAGSCALLLVGGTLYARAPALAPAAFVAVDADTLAPLGRVLRSELGAEAAAWQHFDAAEDFTPVCEGQAPMPQPVVVTDGRLVHFVWCALCLLSFAISTFLTRCCDVAGRAWLARFR